MDSVWHALLSKIIKSLGTKTQNTQSTNSLQTPPVTITGQPPLQNPSPALKRKSKLGSLTLTDQGHSTRKSSKDAKGEAEAERSVTAGTLANPKPSTASLDSRKSNDSKKGKPQTAAVAQPIVSSDSSASHTHRSSLPISHSSFSQKNDVLQKGQVASTSDNTLIADVTSLATDPSQLSSNTAPADNVFPQSQGEIQADLSVSNDPSAKTQTDDVEDTKFSNQHFVLSSRGRKCVTDSRGRKLLKVYEELLMLPEVLIWKTFNQIEIKPEMIGTYLAEYSISYKPVKHGLSIQINSSETELLKRPLLRYSGSCHINLYFLPECVVSFKR